jgi:hypothetical protein
VKKRKYEKNEASFCFGTKQRKTNIIDPQLSKICHGYARELTLISVLLTLAGREGQWATLKLALPPIKGF